MDQSKKTMRHFYCRDVLWETFEQMANDFDCSIDYLVNEAMRYYARSKNYQSPGGPPAQTNPPPIAGNNNNSGAQPHFGGNGPAKPAAMPGRSNPATSQPPMVAAGANGNGASSQQRRPQPPTPGYAARNVGANTAGPTSHMPASSMQREAPQPMPPVQNVPSPGTPPTLFLIYNGQRYPVTKDQFIIGRGSKTSDLPIKDGNISRKHAAVIRRNGTFYIKDLGSTNGIDYKGMRIDNKRIDEGDVFHLCDYELRFTYRVDG
jgi:FHA domain-containing protein